MAIKYINVLDGQSIWNIATQEYGSRDGAVQLMIDNPGLIDFENTPTPGTKIKIDTSKIINQDVINNLIAKGLKPATAVEVADDSAHGDSILLETGGYLLLESGGSILLD